MKMLLLEDNPARVLWFQAHFSPEEGYELMVTRKPKIALKWLNEYRFAAIFLDHDLGIDEEGEATTRVYIDSKEYTGYAVAEAIPKCKNNEAALILIHSWNPVGSARMQEVLGGEGMCSYQPFGTDGFKYAIALIKDTVDMYGDKRTSETKES